MDYYCAVCDKTSKIKCKRKNLQSFTHNDFEKYIRTKHTIKNPHSFDIDEIFHKYINIHKIELNFYLAEHDLL